MSGQHTPEPWDAFHLYGSRDGDGYVIRAERPAKSGRHHGRIDSSGQFSKDDAARIVACVNALAGMDDPVDGIGGLQAESLAYDDAIRVTIDAGIRTLGGLSDAVKALVAQRDEMLAALKAVVSVADRATVEFDMARAAIAKAGAA